MRAALVLAAGLALAAPPVPAQIDGPRSGADFLTPDTRALQDDDFLNPGLFAVEEGRAAGWRRGRAGTPWTRPGSSIRSHVTRPVRDPPCAVGLFGPAPVPF